MPGKDELIPSKNTNYVEETEKLLGNGDALSTSYKGIDSNKNSATRLKFPLQVL